MVGVDVVDVERLRGSLTRRPGVTARIFTTQELRYCSMSRDPVVRLAGTLAAKEAVIKALRLGPLVAWARRIEISREPSGAPRARVRSGRGDTEIDVSISHDGQVAVAIAVQRG